MARSGVNGRDISGFGCCNGVVGLCLASRYEGGTSTAGAAEICPVCDLIAFV